MWNGLTSGFSSALNSLDQVSSREFERFEMHEAWNVYQVARDVAHIAQNEANVDDEEGHTYTTS